MHNWTITMGVKVMMCQNDGVSNFWGVALMGVELLGCRTYGGRTSGVSHLWGSNFWGVALMGVELLGCRTYGESNLRDDSIICSYDIYLIYLFRHK